jgi:hypothetical protein
MLPHKHFFEIVREVKEISHKVNNHWEWAWGESLKTNQEGVLDKIGEEMSEQRSILATKSVLAVILSRETPFLDDETRSRHRFEVKNARFWRRDPFSSLFWGKKCPILATRINLVTFFGRKTSYFGDETYSRHHFPVKNALFWRRDPFSSPFWSKKCPILATRINLVTILR